jgi:branched-chain amino acid transport system ATP-binding protein
MVAMGRALMTAPQLLLPGRTDVGTRPPVTNTMFEALEEGLTLLLVEQRDDGALAVAEYAYVMATCEVVAERSAAQSRADERVRAAYLGGGAMTTS